MNALPAKPKILGGNVDHIPMEPGEWQIREIEWSKGQCGPMYLFGCPNGRGTCGVPIQPSPPNRRGASWVWNGNTKAPTLTPSVNCTTVDEKGKPTGGCGFHATLMDGEWRA